MRRSDSGCLLLLVLLMPPILLSVCLVVADAQTIPGIHIKPDGSIEGTNAIVCNGTAYSFTSNLTGPLVVEKDNIVIDGAGHTLTGSHARGIVLAERHGVTLRNARVTLDGGYIIDVGNSSSCTVADNTLVGTPPAWDKCGPIVINLLLSQSATITNNSITRFFYAIAVESSTGATITGNTLTNGVIGIELQNSEDCKFKDNTLTDCKFSINSFPSYKFANDLDTSNTVDGKPIYYWVGTEDKTVPSDASYIVLIDCANILVENSSPNGICLARASNSTVRNIRMVDHGEDGINLLNCSTINILDCTLRNQAIALQIESSSNNLIKGNDISGAMTRGINLNNAPNNEILQNHFFNNSYGIGFSEGSSNGCLIAHNNFTSNGYALSIEAKDQIIDNLFADNDCGVMLCYASDGNITGNTFIENKVALTAVCSSNNIIYCNNFFRNDHQIGDGGVPSTTATPTPEPTPTPSSTTTDRSPTMSPLQGVNFLPPPPPSHNQFDNGSVGNYWIDYSGSDPNHDGIGDTTYFLYNGAGINQDNFPLMNSLPVAQVPNAPHDLLHAQATTETSQSTTPASTDQSDRSQLSDQAVVFGVPLLFIAITVAALVLGIASLLLYRWKNKRKSV